MTDVRPRRLQAELAHWRIAIDGLADLEEVASPAAWAALEHYLQRQVRGRLSGLVASLRSEADSVERLVINGGDPPQARAGVLHLRRRYLQAETLLDYYGDAVNSRTNPELAALLQGFDVIAGDSMARSLEPLGLDSPPALVYVDKGLGAAILRAGIRLWDQGHPSPAAAIKLTRHNLSFPTALLHETGHQVAALAGLNEELAAALQSALAPESSDLARMWSSWSSEIAADVHAFLHAGWAPAFALSNVVDGTTDQVFRIRPGDPHPFPWVRVMFNVALCRRWFGSGPWDDLASAWMERHPPEQAGAAGLAGLESLRQMDTIIEVCTTRPMRSLRGRAFAELLDPRRVAPAALKELETTAGETLLTSGYLRRRDSIRILAMLSTRSLLDPVKAPEHRRALKNWVRLVGSETNKQTGRAA